MKSFEEISDRKIPLNFEKLTQLSGGLEKNNKQFLKVHQQFEDIRGKYNRNKSDFVLNGKMRNAASFISLGEGYSWLTSEASSADRLLSWSEENSRPGSRISRQARTRCSSTRTLAKCRVSPEPTTS